MDSIKEAKIKQLQQEIEEKHTKVMAQFQEVAEILNQIAVIKE